MDIILATKSPRRKEILKNAGYTYKIAPSNYDEKISNLKYDDEIVKNCAYQKALDVSKREDGIIVSADTVVVFDNTILGKPKDKKDAFNMLKKLSGHTHFVATAVCVISKNKVISDIEKTNVTFRKLSDEEIISYIDKLNPLDKAGSYGIQDEGFDFATSIEGNLDNVIGFPIQTFKKMIEKI